MGTGAEEVAAGGRVVRAGGYWSRALARERMALVSNAVVHWEITGRDGASLQAFYAGAFGWKVDAHNPMNYGLVEANGRGIGGGISGAPQPHGVMIYIEVDDLDATLAAIERLGGKTVTPPTEIPGMVTFAQFSDPEGNLIGLVKRES